jgi:hypothetical protein
LQLLSGGRRKERKKRREEERQCGKQEVREEGAITLGGGKKPLNMEPAYHQAIYIYYSQSERL